MDYSQCARQLAVGLSERQVSEGLAEANDSHRKDRTLTTSWLGLPTPLRKKMINRTAAGLDMHEESGIVHLVAVLLTVSGALLTIMTSVLTAADVNFAGISSRIGLLWAVSLTMLAAGATVLRADRKSANPYLALTPMEQVVVRGYIAAPPNLFQSTDAGITTRLVALAALVARGIHENHVWQDDQSLVDTAGFDLDRTVVSIYELGHQINEARAQLASAETGSEGYESGGTMAELAGAMDHAEAGLETLVGQLCVYADSLLQVEQLFQDEELPASMMDQTIDAMVHDLLTSAARAEDTARELDMRCHELQELKSMLDARQSFLIGSWPGHAPG